MQNVSFFDCSFLSSLFSHAKTIRTCSFGIAEVVCNDEARVSSYWTFGLSDIFIIEILLVFLGSISPNAFALLRTLSLTIAHPVQRAFTIYLCFIVIVSWRLCSNNQLVVPCIIVMKIKAMNGYTQKENKCYLFKHFR